MSSLADIVKMVESQPDLAPQLRRVRGGYLKIQGTWMPYEIAMRLARRFVPGFASHSSRDAHFLLTELLGQYATN